MFTQPIGSGNASAQHERLGQDAFGGELALFADLGGAAGSGSSVQEFGRYSSRSTKARPVALR